MNHKRAVFQGKDLGTSLPTLCAEIPWSDPGWNGTVWEPTIQNTYRPHLKLLPMIKVRNSYLNTIYDVLNINNYLSIKKLSNSPVKKHRLSSASKYLTIRIVLVQGQNNTNASKGEEVSQRVIRLLESCWWGSFIKTNATRHPLDCLPPKLSQWWMWKQWVGISSKQCHNPNV